MNQPILLDTFCCAGGSATGYERAGFVVYGIDKKAQPRFPFPFIKIDTLKALDILLSGDKLTFNNGENLSLDDISVIHASPPCQIHSRMRKLNVSQGVAKNYKELIAPVRTKLKATGKIYIIENVEGSPLIDPITLCGSSFGLLVRRHRLFESNVSLWGKPCAHYIEVKDKPNLNRLHKGNSRVVGCYGHGRGKGDTVELWSKAMGIDWMSRHELSQAIPPAYTEWIGSQVIDILNN